MVDTSVTLFGNLTRDPDRATTPSGVQRTSLRVASTERRFDRQLGRFSDAATVFVNVTCWRALATHVGEALGKGDPVVVIGRLKQRSYDKQGVSITVTDIEADTVAVDLRRGTVGRFRRPLRMATSEDAFDTTPPADAAAVAEEPEDSLEADLSRLADTELAGAAGAPPF